ncbi:MULTISPECIES: protein translocase subunit SecF [unclassified Methylobacterium]|jgi:preprotein translocase subunit SecF|uniref:protein translocase subunit SecF n=1 Tax=unclassified Methylobacterium TaxID=2615210 RepID=UPI001353FD12|nr:protein translocase subunit SecF [Methylobacterium sp. 2A]MWV24448.1 protein translocase subunit SecF [Methylobacterium sp. 2A]
MRLLRLWPDESHFDFMRFRRVTFPLSAVLSLATVVLFLTVGLNFGIDFKGGTLVELQAKSGTADVAAIRHTAAAFGYGEPEVQELGNQGTVLVRLPLQPGEQGQTAVMNKAHAAFDTDYDFRRTETVGPRVSGELVQSGTLGVVLSVVAVLLYLWFRFERELALGAIVGTLHDIVLTVGVFIITRIEFNMTSIAAILTIVGYSLNETVVVFDRTRELMRRYKTIPTVDLLNLSINSTMSRTVMTSISSALSLLALVLFGGEAIKGFATVMLCGVLICTYSAIFISTPVLIYLGLMLSGARAASERSGVPQPAE